MKNKYYVFKSSHGTEWCSSVKGNKSVIEVISGSDFEMFVAKYFPDLLFDFFVNDFSVEQFKNKFPEITIEYRKYKVKKLLGEYQS